MNICWSKETTPVGLQKALRLLACDYPIFEDQRKGSRVVFKEISGTDPVYSVHPNGDGHLIEYQTLSAALRAVGGLLAGEENDSGQSTLTMLGILLECSRGAVMKIDHFKNWLKKLSLMGYNTAMLYTKDTYQLPDEPYFGYLRGGYSDEELREIDRYAANLGIEMIPCIQTLGHLEPVFKWPAYQAIQDTNHIVLVGEEKTYTLIEKMIRFWSECYHSRRIHLGMDESHDLGLGRHLDIHGYRDRSEIFAEHLNRVKAICRKYGLKPMIWSDMYFRNVSRTRDYYDKTMVISEADKARVHTDVEAVYWDYYHDSEAFYCDWIDRHRQLGCEPIMAGGIWTWGTFWYNRQQTEKTTKPCLNACRKQGIKEILFTMWGDDGSYCDFDSAMAGLAWAAEEAWNAKVSEDLLKKRFVAVCHSDYDECLIPCGMSEFESAGLLWDDPILGIFWRQMKLKDETYWPRAQQRYREILDRLERCHTQTTGGGDLNYARALLQCFHDKIQLKGRIDEAYLSNDKTRLGELIKEIPFLIDRLDQFDQAFRTQWLRRNSRYGLEVLQIRFAGQKRRWQEFAMVLQDYMENRMDRIPELESDSGEPLPFVPVQYSSLATSSYFL
jgi:hypothetical protein